MIKIVILGKGARKDLQKTPNFIVSKLKYWIVQIEIEGLESISMTIKKKSSATAFLDGLTGGPLTIGEILRSLRKSDELTQEQFASTLEISKQHLCDIEKGRKAVSPSRAAIFARRLGQSPTFFIQIALQEELDSAGVRIKIRVDAA